MAFKIGDRVKVIGARLQTKGAKGTINRKGFSTKGAYVTLDSGLQLYYNFLSLMKINDINNNNDTEENKEMTILNTENFMVAKVKFLTGTNTNVEYEYALFDPFVVGDTVVVSSAHHGLGIAKITDIIDRDKAATKKFEREIVCKVEMDAYNIRREKRIKATDLNNRMNQRVQELNQLAIFEMMAEKDENLKSMLDEYKTLIG